MVTYEDFKTIKELNEFINDIGDSNVINIETIKELKHYGGQDWELETSCCRLWYKDLFKNNEPSHKSNPKTKTK